ncbi:MAG: hypothetical protein IKE70_00810 [Bacilli bacterium]|nr:hypothetical protein [Bacilli bacterium]
MRNYPKEKLTLISIGNSISNGISFVEPGKLLLDRNLGLINLGNRNYDINDCRDVIDSIATQYENKAGDYNYFLDFIKPYIKKRYPFDFYRISEEKNISKDIDHMKKIKG